jgi:hypothetical protein
MRTKRAIETTTRAGLPFTIPAGARVEPAKLGPTEYRPRYWVKPATFPAGSIERHDATFYGVSVSADDVEASDPANYSAG